MTGLERIAQTQFDTSMKDRVWNAVSKEKLKNLKETFILEFCEHILGGFTEDEVGQMLEEHKRTGFVKNAIYSAHLQTSYVLNQGFIIDAVTKKADSMKTEWIPEIVDAVKKEGIPLPRPGTQTHHSEPTGGFLQLTV